MRNSVIVIPAYEPSSRLIDRVNELVSNGFEKIVVIDDGSGSEYQAIFDVLSKHCKILHHEVNQGKGAALKTGFCYYLQHWYQLPGVITMDADGQHSVQDIIKMEETMNSSEEGLFIGTRDVDLASFPDSRKGYVKATRTMFKLLYGVKLQDTESGLRGISQVYVPFLLDANGERFDYETNMLMEAIHYHFPITEVPIETIFFKAENDSHFNPITDAFKTYMQLMKEFVKYSITSLMASGIDIVVYTVLLVLMRDLPEVTGIFVSTAIARVISSFANYCFNSKLVFNNHDDMRKTIIKYYFLCGIQMICSACTVYGLSQLIPITTVVIKALVDITLFFVFYRVQKFWVFKN